MRVLPAGAGSVLVELDDLPRTLGLLASLRAEPLAGVREIVPGARTLLIEFDPLALTRASLATDLARRPLDGGVEGAGERVEIPVHYDGEDLAEVAAFLKISPEEVVRRHTGGDWSVAFTGFAPGFAYLTGGDELLRQVPRRAAPRTRIPAGAVAVAGGFSGVYPKASPGGWQLLGQTATPMWDLDRDPPALLQPGQRVRFVDVGPRVASAPAAPAAASLASTIDEGAPALIVEATGLQTVMQDLGRPGRAGQGVSASGAMDRGSLRAANLLLGNEAGAAALETVLGGLRLRARGDHLVAVTGAAGPLTLVAADGTRRPVQRHRAVTVADGEALLIGAPEAGLRSYVAVRGGWDAAPVLGSRGFDSLAGIGPAPLKVGDRLKPGVVEEANAAPDAAELPKASGWPAPGGCVTLDVLLGPRSDWFDADAVALLSAQRWTVSPQSNRVGLRLSGERSLMRTVVRELPSEGTVAGAIQVPTGGQPVLLLADHPLTGGYPVIACVAPHHLDLAGQLGPGTRVRFRVVAPFEPIELPGR